MSSTSIPSDSPPHRHQHQEEDNNNLQPFFLLHNSSPPQKSSKTRRKIHLTDSSSSSLLREQDCYDQLRVRAFNIVWFNIELTINQLLRDINLNVFDEIHRWVLRSFTSISASSATGDCPYPTTTTTSDIDSSNIFTGLVFTRNVEFVDDLLTFKHLNLHLKSQGCHVVNLSSVHFSPKNGIAACITALLRHLLLIEPDVADIAILASWYNHPHNYGHPIVVIIDDMERCNGPLLSHFIQILNHWAIRLPIILVMGVATTVDALTTLLPASALKHLCPCKFALGSPAERLNAIAEAVILPSNQGFYIGHNIAVFLRNYFLRHDGTVTSFVRALKIACAKHFLMEPLSFLCTGLLDEDCHSFLIEKCVSLPESMLQYAFGLPSCKFSGQTPPVTGEALASGLSEIHNLRKNWCTVFLCLHEAAKLQNVQLLDILCEALDPALYSSRFSTNHHSGKDLAKSSLLENSVATKRSLIFQVIGKLRDLSVKSLQKLLLIWQKHSEEIGQVHEKLNELQSLLSIDDESNGLQRDITSLSKRPASGSYMNRSKVNEQAVLLMESMVKEYLKPMECKPFHEILCFKHVDILQSALVGDPRRMIQVDLLKSHTCLRCSCCTKSKTVLLPSMHDTSIMYTLAQEHGDLINLHDWFQSFKSAILRPCTNDKSKMHSPSSKKRKQAIGPEDASDASIQARFCRAVIELQITGLLRMPNKRRPDYVHRVAFGL